MKLLNTDQLLEQDELYGYCHKTQEYEILTELTDIIEFKGRKGIKGFDSEGNKLYTQVNNQLYEQLVDKFEILKNNKIN
jgi:hypothetical protein